MRAGDGYTVIIEGYVQKRGSIMINFINTFLSYIVLAVIIVAVAGVAMAIGLTLAKKKNAKKAED